MTEKYEWRTAEKEIYPNKKAATIVTLPPQTFITLSGTGNPNDSDFGNRVAALYAISYAIKMAPKKGIQFPNAFDYTVYPLEGFWTLPKDYHQEQLDKNQLIYQIMIKQPDFVTPAVFAQALELAAGKITPQLLNQLSLETKKEGTVAMIRHVGAFANEPVTFAQLADFLEQQGYHRTSKAHKEIYLSDFRRVAEEKRKTILRVTVAKN
ncbi:GyrI-like domain-containing protein [Pediococcus siamensis]|uniref:GyrI-like domain-containing protein n=1 Tax=Pediococcus siamensis TaxID=381829 RepID=UPI0039A2326B